MNERGESLQQRGKSLRILVVEDHDETRQTLSNLLTHFGHQVSVAQSQRNALEMLGARTFDVLLSDIALPDGTGYAVVTQAKSAQPLKGVALTALHSEEDVARGKQAGFDFHLSKPVDFHELRSVLQLIGG